MENPKHEAPARNHFAQCDAGGRNTKQIATNCHPEFISGSRFRIKSGMTKDSFGFRISDLGFSEQSEVF